MEPAGDPRPAHRRQKVHRPDGPPRRDHPQDPQPAPARTSRHRNHHRRPRAGQARGLVPADTGRSRPRTHHRHAQLVGLRHAWRWPLPGEPLHAEHLLRSVTQAIDLATGDHEPARWHFRLDGADYLAESDGHHWSLAAKTPPAPADVTITATTQALTALIFTGSDADIDITGKPRAVEQFRRLISTMATVVHPV